MFDLQIILPDCANSSYPILQRSHPQFHKNLNQHNNTQPQRLNFSPIPISKNSAPICSMVIYIKNMRYLVGDIAQPLCNSQRLSSRWWCAIVYLLIWACAFLFLNFIIIPIQLLLQIRSLYFLLTLYLSTIKCNNYKTKNAPNLLLLNVTSNNRKAYKFVNNLLLEIKNTRTHQWVC